MAKRKKAIDVVSLKVIIRMILIVLVSVSIIALIMFGLPRIITYLFSINRIYTVNEAPAEKVAVVFGAGLWWDGSPTPVLMDRVSTAAELYFSGKVEKLLMSGDNRTLEYNEPGAMREFALNLGVPDDKIVLDYAGRRTYDTCYRARDIFGIQNAILVTQKYHLPRALYVCNQLGITSIGVAADRRAYTRRSSLWWNLREIPATLAALWEVHISRPLPVLGEKEPIFSKESK